MSADLTVRDAMTREFVGVNEADDVAGAAALMVEAGVEGAAVLRGSTPVGTLDARDVLSLVADGRDPAAVPVGDAMSPSTATIDPDAPVAEAVSTFLTRDVRRLFVAEGEELLGTLSEHDVVTAQSTFPEPEAPVATPAGAGPTDDRYSTQSVCEACGSLAENLVSVNGQLLCVDCRGL